MTSVCAWCGKLLATGGGSEPVSHGICPACAEGTGLFPVEELLSMTAEDFDRLPIGIIGIDSVGTIVAYNRAEERLAGFDRARMLGRNFFTEVAPCTRVAAFQGRYQELTSRGELGEMDFSFVFRFASGDRMVLIHLVYDPARERGIIAVQTLE